MSLYIYRIVIDANVINARGKVPAMPELESFFDLGVIEILKTSALGIELQGYKPGKEKAKSYGTIYGDNWLGHVQPSVWAGRKSNFKTIYETLWGKMWKKGGASRDRIHHQSLRDAIHLDICWINQVDFFVTDEKAIIARREALYAQGFDVKIVRPLECLACIKDDFQQDFGTDNVTIISKRIQETRRILLGSNSCEVAFIQDLETGETLFRTHWIDGQLHIEANLYDSSGAAVAKLRPHQQPEILYPDVSLSSQDGGPRVFYIINPAIPCPKIEQYLRIGNDPSSQFVIVKRGEIILSGHIVPTGHVLFEGKFFNARGVVVAEIEKKSLKYYGLCFINSRGTVFPSGSISMVAEA